MRILLTGAAGFIGYHVAEALLKRGDEVLGVDNLNAYYTPDLKKARLAGLRPHNAFRFEELDIAGAQPLIALAKQFKPERIVHLAAQAGVRYSLEAPFAYTHSNVVGHLAVLEAARALDGLEHLVYASSSSVYGANTKVPFSEADPVNQPISLYAATKRAAELMSETYRHLYKIPQTGLRFFTVYGPWGRPDMAPWIFTEATLKGKPIALYAGGTQRRDFTYIDDIVRGVVAATDRLPGDANQIYNLGNHHPEPTRKLIEIIERATGKKAITKDEPARLGDVEATYADIQSAHRDLGFQPTTSLEDGIPRFVAWYRKHYGI